MSDTDTSGAFSYSDVDRLTFFTTSGCPECRRLRAEVERLRRLIANDAYAITFQTMGQYRTALLREIATGRGEGDG